MLPLCPMAQAVAVALENLTGHAATLDLQADAAQRQAQAQAWRGWFQSTTWDAIETDLARMLDGADAAAAMWDRITSCSARRI